MERWLNQSISEDMCDLTGQTTDMASIDLSVGVIENASLRNVHSYLLARALVRKHNLIIILMFADFCRILTKMVHDSLPSKKKYKEHNLRSYAQKQE